MNILHIMLVESDESKSKIFFDSLNSSKNMMFEIFYFKSLSAAISSLEEKKYDIILLDLNLNDHRGIDTFKEVRSVTDTPIIVITDIFNETDAIDAVSLGAQDYIVNYNLSPYQITQSIRHAIERDMLSKDLKDLRMRKKREIEENKIREIISKDDIKRFKSKRLKKNNPEKFEKILSEFKDVVEASVNDGELSKEEIENIVKQLKRLNVCFEDVLEVKQEFTKRNGFDGTKAKKYDSEGSFLSIKILKDLLNSYREDRDKKNKHGKYGFGLSIFGAIAATIIELFFSMPSDQIQVLYNGSIRNYSFFLLTSLFLGLSIFFYKMFKQENKE